MMTSTYQTRIADCAADIEAAQRLRHRAFFEGQGRTGRADGRDVDDFDDKCLHVLVEDRNCGQLFATMRLLPLGSGAEIPETYSAQYYNLDALKAFDRPMVEMGRFCIEPGVTDPDILRAAFAAVTSFVDREGVALLFGCSSFQGTDARAYEDAFAMLKERYLAPKRWLPRIKAPNVFQFAQRLRRKPDRARALKTMPPLLRSYLTMGGWVSDHAVVDRDMNTLHVFTGLEIGAIPPGRARALRAVAG